VPTQINPRSAKRVTFAPAATQWSRVLMSDKANAAMLDAQ
jgi:hypothetical protein